MNQRLKEVIENNQNGFTCNLKGELSSYQKGYFIGITHIKGKNLNLLLKKVLFIKEKGFNHMDNLFLGGWSDKGIFYLDLSLYSEKLSFAKSLGKMFNQLAIFDIKGLKEIFL